MADSPTPPLPSLIAHYAGMPPVAAMAPAVEDWADGQLRLRAPLAANVNDKGCAFGGSLGSLLTLAGWGLLQLRLEAAGMDADIFVADSRLRFRAPLYADLVAEAELADPVDWGRFLRALHERGRGRILVRAVVPLPGGGPATESESDFAAIVRRPAAASG